MQLDPWFSRSSNLILNRCWGKASQAAHITCAWTRSNCNHPRNFQGWKRLGATTKTSHWRAKNLNMLKEYLNEDQACWIPSDVCWYCWSKKSLHPLIGSVSPYLPGFLHPRWLAGFLPHQRLNLNGLLLKGSTLWRVDGYKMMSTYSRCFLLHFLWWDVFSPCNVVYFWRSTVETFRRDCHSNSLIFDRRCRKIAIAMEAARDET